MSSMQQSDLASQHPTWDRLHELADQAGGISLDVRLTTEPDRVSRWRLSPAGLTADLARHFLDEGVETALLQLAEEQAVSSQIQDLFAGRPVNNTEKRAAIHPLLRQSPSPAEVSSGLAAMTSLVDGLWSGELRGFTGRAITDVVNVGIGGSDLGPRMVVAALRNFHAGPVRVHFLANVDPADFVSTTASLDPETTLFLVASKSWTTQETQVNAAAARRWLAAAGATETAMTDHFIAITANPARARQDGVSPERILPFDEAVGGRYSLWSTIGLPIACAIGMEGFTELLAGAREMDDHFRDAPLRKNLPFLLGALDVWYTACWGVDSIAVLPYSHDLALLPSYLQQLTMESNGKRVTRSGHAVDYPTCPVFWGEAGTRGQHSFHQLLHQGPAVIPCDFILPLTTHDDPEQHRLLVANCLAQAQALTSGISEQAVAAELVAGGTDAAEAARLAPHKMMPGNRPSTLISFPTLSPRTLGALIALYEHRVYASAALWGINPFDQWGVELGKKISATIAPCLAPTGAAPEPDGLDPLTSLLINDYQSAHQDAP